MQQNFGILAKKSAKNIGQSKKSQSKKISR